MLDGLAAKLEEVKKRCDCVVVPFRELTATKLIHAVGLKGFWSSVDRNELLNLSPQIRKASQIQAELRKAKSL